MTTWGYILDMPGRPKVAEQRRVLTAMGVDMGVKGTCWRDRLKSAKRHATAGQTQLVERNALLTAALEGDRVIVTDPTCLGVSSQDASWFAGQLAARKVSLTANGDLWHIEPGDDTAALINEVFRLIRNRNTARSRGKSN